MNAPFLLFLPLSLVFLAGSQASEVATKGAEVGKWTQDYEAATALAKEKNLPLLLNFTGSDWSDFSKIMDSNVYAKPEWEAFAAKNLVLVTVDFPKDKTIVPAEYIARNYELKDKFNINGYPSYIILESDAETQLGKLDAGKEKTPESFIAEVQNVFRFRESNIDAKIAALGEEKGMEYLAAMASLRAAEASLGEWLETEPEQNDENDKKFEEFTAAIARAQAKLDSF